MAVFPGGLLKWTNRRNQVDDVDAGDVNVPVAEIIAIQQVLGINPQLDTDLNAKRNDYGTVANRMRWLARGYDRPVIRLESAAEPVPQGTSWTAINFDSPNVVSDTFGMFDGTGFTIKRSGWWQLSGDLRWPNTDTTGYRMASLFSGSAELAGDVRNAGLDGAGSGAYIRQNFSWQGWLAKGAKITIKAVQTSNHTLTATGVTLSGTHARDGS